jgi:hypothetical protein
LRDALYGQARKALELAECGPSYCLGDLFDTESNDELVIKQGYQVASMCQRTLAGNHDLPNREGKLSSLQLIAGMVRYEDQVVLGSVGEPGFALSREGNAAIFMVPHMASQHLFDTSISEAIHYAMDGWRQSNNRLILCLHCNYNSGLIHNDASLNLTSRQAEELLETFDFILLGHEHMPRRLHNDRLIILGNTHPTSFSDISDKFIWEFDGKEFKSHKIWNARQGHCEVDWQTLVKPWTEAQATRINAEGAQFLDITGAAPPDMLPKVAAGIAQLWRDNPDLLMVRNSVQSEFVAPEVHQATRTLDLPTRISTALEDTDLLPIWQSYLEKAQ